MHALQLFYCAAAALLFRQLTDVRQEIQVLREALDEKTPELVVQQVLALKIEHDQLRTQVQTLQQTQDTVTREVTDCLAETADLYGVTTTLQKKLFDFEENIK